MPEIPAPPSTELRLRTGETPLRSTAGDVEARIPVNGQPIIAEAFDRGAAHAPERLLDGETSLRATAEPHEVQLAEAWCTEGCCGALYVTIERDLDTVRWHEWRTPTPHDQAVPPLRFDAAAYDAEITRAEQDHGWEWPARTAARLIRRRLAAEPQLLERWDCHLSWVYARHHERDQLRLSFTYPGRAKVLDPAPWLQFELVLTITDNDPAELVDEFIASLSSIDPKSSADVAGGSAEYAAALGYPWPDNTQP